MPNIYGVMFKEKGKIYFFNGKNLDLKNDTKVIVETERGKQLGKIASKVSNDILDKQTSPLKEILRVSTEKDYNIYLKNLEEAEIALKKAKKMAEELRLNMTFIDSSYTFDKRQLLFNFLADERVDFRELAKRLASIYRTRIELRQIGVRDKAREIGGVGICGRELCCASFLNHIESITMNTAKNQNIPLNPSKINGACGRLLCCLTYEDDEYTKCSKGMPRVGEIVDTPSGRGKVISTDILNRRYKVDVNNDKILVELGECPKRNR